MPSVLENSIPSGSRTRFAAQNNLGSYLGNDPPAVENEEIQDSLADYVRKQFDRAKSHRSAIGIDARLIRNLYAMRCEYTPEELALLDVNTQVYIGLCALKARAGQSWLRDIILNNIDKPWTMKDTPIPDLPEEARERVLDLLEMELSSITNVSGIRERAKELKTVALDQAKEIAERAVRKHEKLIEDQLAENNFRTAFSELIEDITVYPSVFVRGPFTQNKEVAHWRNNSYNVSTKVIPDVRVINPFDAYPSPSSTAAHNGEFFIEKAPLSQGAIYDCIGVSGFDETNIRAALAEYSDGFKLDPMMDSERERLEQTNQDTLRAGNEVDTIIYNGTIPGRYLASHGVLVKDPQKHYECEIWQVGNYVIKAVLNPDNSGRRPLYSTSYIKVNRNIWGQSVVDLVYDTMRVCNASVRSLVRNMAISSGPIGEAVADRIADGTDPREVQPHKIFLVTPDLVGSNQPAFRWHNVDSIANDLLAVFDKFSKIADDLSGIPAYVLGNPQVAGAGRTMGGLSMLMGNAAKGIKNVQLNIDQDIVAPFITSMYVYNMRTSDDITIKADARVIATGATGLLQRELSQSRLVEILQMLAPFIPIWEKMPDGLRVLLREILKQTGLPVDKVLADPYAEEELVSKVRELTQAEGFFRGTSDPVPLPPQSEYPGSETNVNPQSMPLSMPGPA